MDPAKRPLWKCPKCGRRFVTRNIEHTCRVLRVTDHLHNKSPQVRALYQKMETMARRASSGKMEIVPVKTGITFRGRVSFAWIRVLRERLDVGLMLPTVLRSPRVKKIYTQSLRSHYHSFDVRSPGDLDAEFATWMREAWRAGQQKQLGGGGSGEDARAIPESTIASAAALTPAGAARAQAAAARPKRPLWRCPKCGKYYVTRNIWHSCHRYTEAERLAGKSDHAVWLYRRIVKMLRECGPVRIVPGKTMIVFQGRMRFANARLGRDCVHLGFILARRLDEERIKRVTSYGPRCFGHSLTVRSADDLDTELHAWLAESFRLGMQERT